MTRYINEGKPEKLASQAAEGKKVRFGDNNGYQEGGNRI
jgi:hypothetical protein